VKLGELAGDNDGAVAENGGEIIERVENAVGGFVENEGAFIAAELFEELAALGGFGGKESGEEEGRGGESGGGEGGEEGGRSGNGDDGDSGADGGMEQAESGIGNEGGAGIGDKGDAIAVVEALDQLG